MSSPATLPRLYVKVIQMSVPVNTKNQEQMVPLVFVHYRKAILVPDFNIHTLLQIIDPLIDTAIIENYVTYIGCCF